jgi:hypothetical protein
MTVHTMEYRKERYLVLQKDQKMEQEMDLMKEKKMAHTMEY